ncbi:ring-cleaving dioxygenase [Granulicella sp. 5B5]|uniref:ring-cleaving dioxygenase n=1 Tax=Granulicella sp. 5B5 TaxID=1617967 RepID=UPI0015F68AF1|nr:ring-cleaving dioxygenase [Granulicella sp. 5B5]QMV19499.1 ring-cleaving dioxygenase [Granulicella sp. 5B5]
MTTTTPQPIVGLHHVTAIASDPQRNLDFYTEVLGLRFVKRTVNFDDPGTYHFYFGDDAGTPGTILTFFPWPHARRGHAGAGEVSDTAFSVPVGSLDYWEQRLAAFSIPVERSTRFNEELLTFPDPDGMKLEIVAHADAPAITAPRYADVPTEHALRGFFGVTMLETDLPATEKSLELLGFKKVAEENNRIRFASPAGSSLGNHIDVVVDPKATYGNPGAGSVHHIAFRAQDDPAQLAWREVIAKHLSVTPVLDRTYFHSIYFREPGGVLFELATDNPGFGIDETPETLGEALRIPSWLEPQRALIEARLAPIELHQSSQMQK